MRVNRTLQQRYEIVRTAFHWIFMFYGSYMIERNFSFSIRKEQNTTVKNKPRTAKVGAISKAQNCKRGDSLGFVKLQLVAKYEKNELNSVTVSKNVKGGTLWAL